MVTRVFALIAVCFLLAPGCNVAGGGGSVHVPPTVIQYGKPTILRYELSVWGGGDARKDYTNIRCHYKAANATSITAISGVIVSASDKRIIVQFQLPALSPSDGKYIEYYFDEIFDGKYNKRQMERVALE